MFALYASNTYFTKQMYFLYRLFAVRDGCIAFPIAYSFMTYALCERERKK